MNRICAALSVLSVLAWATVQAGDATVAGPRDAPEYYVTPPPETAEEMQSRKTAEMEVLLRRLVGRFRIEYPWVLAMPQPANAPRTVVDCVAIGAGPGVHCIYYLARSQAVPDGHAGAARKQQVPDTPLRRSEVLFVSRIVELGLDPNDSEIKLMKVDPGTAQPMSGEVSSNTLTLTGPCWNKPPPPMPPCEIEQRVMVTADSDDIWIIDYHNWDRVPRNPRYALRRMSQDESDDAGRMIEGAPPAFPRKGGGPR